MSTEYSFTLPWRGKPKPRPRVTSKGTYNDKAYTEWKEAIAEWFNLTIAPSFSTPVEMFVLFKTDEVVVTVKAVEHKRATHVRADIDNLLGGLMDAMQDAGVLVNDSQVVSATVLLGGKPDASK